MEYICKFLECLAPISICNIECEYCYLIQQDRRAMCNPKWDYSPEYIAKALSKKRLGGMAYISICGEGETLISYDVISLTHLLLEEGHCVNITTNGTLSNRFDKLLAFPKEKLKKLHIAFSFHYLELKRKNMIDVFFDNISKVKAAGCSFVLQLNMYDGYMPYIEEIKKISMDRVGAFPQIALTRKEIEKNGKIEYTFHTNRSKDEYIAAAREFNSPLFECTLQNFNVKRNEFCYAGKWSGVLDLRTGDLRQCYSMPAQNIFKDIEKPVLFEPVGRSCPNPYCVNSSHFMSMGVIPNSNIPTYEGLRNRENAGWYNDTMKELLSHKLDEYLPTMSFRERTIQFIKAFPKRINRFIKKILPNEMKKNIKRLVKRK